MEPHEPPGRTESVIENERTERESNKEDKAAAYKPAGRLNRDVGDGAWTTDKESKELQTSAVKSAKMQEPPPEVGFDYTR